MTRDSLSIKLPLNHHKYAVRTNRIFLFLSHYHDHQWAKHLDESQIELGSGKRQVVPEGRYDERYKITVPESLKTNRKP
ncbi:type IV toxin-antitoxin system AbiEi family antitoxin domain-containing protein [Leucothrix mucor]|uniref:type IV toxin-antitoxin system AbiEi family antitoxin domain-containing protein n=1 Tax=Leucothrix mucor TaxID=45248 RepID=UPI001B7F7C1B